MKNSISILGAGAWGTAVATVLAHNNHDVTLWCHEPRVADEINHQQTNGSYLPGIQLQKNIRATTNMQNAIQSSAWVFEAIPIRYLRSVMSSIKPYINVQHSIVILSKGMENKSLHLPGEIIAEELGTQNKIAVVSGPNFAQELAQKMFTTSVVASNSPDFSFAVAQLLENSYFKVQLSNDFIGVQVGGAFKNVIALALGIAHGAGCGENTRAYLLTQGLHEMALITEALGGKAETIYGLSGLGDLVLCCTGSLSRNFKVGVLFGQGHAFTDISRQYQVLPEGINTLHEINTLMNRYSLALPLCVKTYEAVFLNKHFYF